MSRIVFNEPYQSEGLEPQQIRNDFADYMIETTHNLDDAEKLLYALSSYCLLYTSPSPRDAHETRMPSSA